MTKSLRSILTELSCLAVAIIVTILICRFVFLWDFSRDTLGLQLHDSYFVISAVSIIVPLFLLITFILYFIREIRTSFSRTLPNIILFVTGLLLIVMLAFLNKQFIRLGTTMGGWTIYPPLSALPEVQHRGSILNPAASVVTNTLTVLQMVVTIALLYSAFRWGKQTK